MRGSIHKRCAAAALLVLTAACAGPDKPRTELIAHYRCADGSSFSAEVAPAAVRLYTVTGVIELPRLRGEDPPHYTNGLRSIVLVEDGVVRHAIGRRAWTECTVGTAPVRSTGRRSEHSTVPRHDISD